MESYCGCSDPFIGLNLGTTCGGGNFVIFMALVDSVIRNVCDISGICSRITPKTKPDSKYDYVIIGGGSAGSVVAGRLSEDCNCKVLVIERGNDEPVGSQIPSFAYNFQNSPVLDYNFRTQPEKHACGRFPDRRCPWPRGKVLGGTGVVHGMMYMRGLCCNYNEWVHLGNTNWTCKEVFEYFLKSEDNRDIGRLVSSRYHRTGGPLTVMRFPSHPKLADYILLAGREMGYNISNDLNGEMQTGFAIAQTTSSYGVRKSTAKAYLHSARNRNNLHIMLNSTGNRILFDEKKVVKGVELTYNNKTYIVQVGREVIVAGGTVNSPQILLLSGIGPKEVLDSVGIKQVHELPGVGQNLQNHVSFTLTFSLGELQTQSDLNLESLTEYTQRRTGPLSSTGMAQTTARIISRFANSSCPDLQFYFSGYMANCSSFALQGDYPSHNRTIAIQPVVLQPRSRGYISVSSVRADDPPLIYANYLTDPYDARMLVEGIPFGLRIANTSILRDVYGIQLVHESYGYYEQMHSYNSDSFWDCAIRYATDPENHQTGSCKMGPASDPLSVVDQNLQVHGVSGVRVIDASIMPEVVSANIYATIVMIAERGADFIRKKWEPCN